MFLVDLKETSWTSRVATTNIYLSRKCFTSVNPLVARLLRKLFLPPCAMEKDIASFQSLEIHSAGIVKPEGPVKSWSGIDAQVTGTPTVHSKILLRRNHERTPVKINAFWFVNNILLDSQ